MILQQDRMLVTLSGRRRNGLRRGGEVIGDVLHLLLSFLL